MLGRLGAGKVVPAVVYQYLFKRHKQDDRVINAIIARVEKIASGKSPGTYISQRVETGVISFW